MERLAYYYFIVICEHPACKVKPSIKYLNTGFCFKHQSVVNDRDKNVMRNRYFDYNIKFKEDLIDGKRKSLKPSDEQIAIAQSLTGILTVDKSDGLKIKKLAKETPHMLRGVFKTISFESASLILEENPDVKNIVTLLEILAKRDDITIQEVDSLALKIDERILRKFLFKTNRVIGFNSNISLVEFGGFEKVMADPVLRSIVYWNIDSLTEQEWEKVSPKAWVQDMVDSAWSRNDKRFWTYDRFDYDDVDERKQQCGEKCEACLMSNVKLTADHLVPRRLGGNSTFHNLRMLCEECNNRKGSFFDPLWLELLCENSNWTPDVTQIRSLFGS